MAKSLTQIITRYRDMALQSACEARDEKTEAMFLAIAAKHEVALIQHLKGERRG